MSEQVRTAGPDGAERPPPGRKKRKSLVVGIVGGFLTASAVVLALNGNLPFIKKDATLSIVAPAEITDASRTLDPATSEQLASRAKECSVPLAQVAIWKTPAASGGAIRIRSGSYISREVLVSQKIAGPRNIEAGLYPLPADHDGSLLTLLHRSRLFFRGSPRNPSAPREPVL